MNADLRRRQIEALGIAESIAMRLRQILDGQCKSGRYPEEYADIARDLNDIEDRLYGKGEYATESVADLRGGAR